MAAALLSTAACTSTDASGAAAPMATDPVVLRIATNDGPDSPTGAVIAAFARAVADLGDGSLTVVPVWEAAGPSPDDWDQAVSRTVIEGDNQLGLIPARAFDVLGVDTLQPLQTPFLLGTEQRVDAVVRSPLTDELMAGLDTIGLTGLALLPEDLRRIFSYDEPLTAPDDLRGSTIRAPRSDMTDAVFATVGARTDDASGDAWAGAIASGRIQGAETSLAAMAGLGEDHPATTTAGNVVLFPKMNVLVANRAAFESLQDGDRALLRQAAAAALAEPDLVRTEREAAEAYCAVGGRIVAADESDVQALAARMSAVTPPRGSAPVVELTAALEALVADLPRVDPLPACGPIPAGAEQPETPAPAADALLVVDSQIGGSAPESPVVAAAPALQGCTTVVDLSGEMDESDSDEVRFTGTKRIRCAGGEVTIGYEATMDTAVPGVTSGTWTVTGSTLPSVRSGGGRLAGDSNGCRTVQGADGCIRDTFTGTVSP